jgi:hypothetical protein
MTFAPLSHISLTNAFLATALGRDESVNAVIPRVSLASVRRILSFSWKPRCHDTPTKWMSKSFRRRLNGECPCYVHYSLPSRRFPMEVSPSRLSMPTYVTIVERLSCGSSGSFMPDSESVCFWNECAVALTGSFTMNNDNISFQMGRTKEHYQFQLPSR